MQSLIIIGCLVTGLGLIALIYCIVGAMKLRRHIGQDETDPQTMQQLQRLVIVNYAGLAIATLGLCMLIIGLVL